MGETPPTSCVSASNFWDLPCSAAQNLWMRFYWEIPSPKRLPLTLSPNFHLGLSENRVYSQTNSHLIGIIWDNDHWPLGLGVHYFQTHPFLPGGMFQVKCKSCELKLIDTQVALVGQNRTSALGNGFFIGPQLVFFFRQVTALPTMCKP